MIKIDIPDDFIHEFTIQGGELIVQLKFNHSMEIVKGQMHGYLIIDHGVAVLEGANFPAEDFNKFKGKVVIV